MTAQTIVSIARASDAVDDEANVRECLERLLYQLGFDESNYGTPRWNPLTEIIRKGDHVLLKPNLIRQSHLLNPRWEHVITDSAVIAAVVHYVFKALDGTGEIIIADGPQIDSDYDKIYEVLQFEKLKQYYLREHDYHLQFIDLREERWITRDDVIVERIKLPGDPAGYVEFDLAEKSEFIGHQSSGRYYGADYDFLQTQAFHSNNRNRYRLSRTALEADVFINLPKLKTHKKTGVTLSLKNLVGIHGDRNYLPHHTIGTPREGGDEFKSDNLKSALQSRMTQRFKQVLAQRGGTGGVVVRAVKRIGYQVFGSTEEVIRSGNWYGNDTTWRMALDINKLLFYGSTDGTFHNQLGKRRYLTIVDGIIAGEGNGPMAPDPKPCGVLIGGFNPVAVDTVSATLMGFDYHRLPVVARAWQSRHLPLVDFTPDNVNCLSNVPEWTGSLAELERADHFAFRPHFGWKGQIERDPN
jgi:uncharacterized protein (DUF362 family)